MMAYRFEDIPIDLIVNHIGNNITFADVSKLTLVSKNLRTNIKSNVPHLISNIISNNYGFGYYKNELDVDMVNDIKKSALSFLQFEEAIQAIRNIDVTSISFEFDKKTIDTSDESINATFKIFQMFALESESFDKELTFAFIEVFTKSLLKYFSAVFQARNKISQYSEPYCINHVLNKSATNGWYKVNINVYYLYENYNLLTASNRSYKFKSYIENNTKIIMSSQIKRNSCTLMYLMVIMSSGSVQEKLYCFHEIMKLLNYIYTYKTEKMSLLKDYHKFTTTCRRKIYEFKSFIEENRSLLPCYLRKCFLAEYDMFIEITKDV